MMSSGRSQRSRPDWRSENIKIVTGHKTSTVGCSHFAHQVFLRRFGELIALVIKDQEAGTRSRCQISKLSRRGMILASHPLPFQGRFRVASLCIDFMNQNVAAITLFDDALSWASIA